MSSTMPSGALCSLNFAGPSISSTMRIRAGPLPARTPEICARAEGCSSNTKTTGNRMSLHVPVKKQRKKFFIDLFPRKISRTAWNRALAKLSKTVLKHFHF